MLSTLPVILALANLGSNPPFPSLFLSLFQRSIVLISFIAFPHAGIHTALRLPSPPRLRLSVDFFAIHSFLPRPLNISMCLPRFFSVRVPTPRV